MSHIILVRHGQASFLERDYDKLCANGEKQATLLGEYWSRRGVNPGVAYSGPRYARGLTRDERFAALPKRIHTLLRASWQCAESRTI